MMRTILKATKVFGILVAFYLFLGLVAYLMPEGPVWHHAQKSLDSGDLAEDYPQAIAHGIRECQDEYTMDNFTDALVVGQAVNLRSEGLKGILLLPRHDEGIYQYRNLQALLAGSNEGRTIHYGRYWHGSTFVTRLLLLLVSYSGIRYLLYVLSTALLLWCLMRLWRSVGRAVALALVAALLLVNVYVMQFSVQFAPVLFIALGGILWMTRPGMDDNARAALLFFCLGSLTAYFDLLTVPSITLGLPLVVLVAMRREADLRRGLTSVVVMGLWWLAGYALTWLAKWGLATLLTGQDIFSDAYGQGAIWSENGFSYFGDAVASCVGFLHWKYLVVSMVLLIVLAAIQPRRQAWPVALQLLLVALIPFGYYLLMAHPAAHHAWFNYRALATTAAALLLAVAMMTDWKAYQHSIDRLWKKKRNAVG